MKFKLGKDMMAYGAGAGVGVIVPQILRNYVEPTYGAYIPGIDTTLGVWGKYGTFIPILTGAIALIVPAFAKKLRKKTIKGFMTMYGITSLVQGVMNGAFDSMQPTTRASAAYRPRPTARLQPVRRAASVPRRASRYQATPTGLSQATIVA